MIDLKQMMRRMLTIARRALLAGAILGVAASIGAGAARAQESDSLRPKYFEALKGKKIVFLPVQMSMDFTKDWDRTFADLAKQVGMDYSVRDANWSSQTQVQALDALIAEKPDVIIAHNFNVSVLAKQLKRAEDAGILVIQINLKSLYDTTAYVGIDNTQIGAVGGREIIKDCGESSGRNGKVAIIIGEPTASDGIYQIQGLKESFAKDPHIQVVATQSGKWDPKVSQDVTATILQQNPDLCAIWSLWGVQALGSAQAIKEAGLTGRVGLYTASEGLRYGCDAVKSGDFTHLIIWNSTQIPRDVFQIVTFLLQNHVKPGSMKGAVYTPLLEVSKDNLQDTMCWDPVH
jgi:ribose transport system substrate-binding protein